jgi:hypothetical protein
MTDPTSPSPIIECFLRGFKDFLPDDQKAKLETHQDAIAATTSDGDHARARRCAVWAIEAADDKDAAHPRWKEVKELHKIWKDTLLGAEFALGGDLGQVVVRSGIGEDVRTQWAEGASDVIRKLAEEDGWANSHWEDLLVELINEK